MVTLRVFLVFNNIYFGTPLDSLNCFLTEKKSDSAREIIASNFGIF